ncbi:MAG: signal recognition particle-docking protein FtsY [Proteobacteria bacterium]|nr:signal recognition particle-docking protein FtsY [Pseudomonadota bacterium]
MSFFKIFSKTKIKDQLVKSSSKISSGISQIFTQKKLDNDTLEELEDLLLISDIGVKGASEIINNFKSRKFGKEIAIEEVKEALAEEIAAILLPCQKTLEVKPELKPQVIIFNGVNGSGKTTTIGKMAQSLSLSGKKVMIAACDTFRAAASDQLRVWAQRTNCPIVESERQGGDPASVAYRALNEAKNSDIDVLLIDTAGRLQNKKNLMEELKKINQVLKKLDETAPHENILVLDSTTGQNSKNQLEVFDEIVNITGLVITKLDGSAKGGMLVALTEQASKPIYAIGVGENIEDLQEFDAKSFANNLVGVDKA